jgi:hypothetical protein
MRKLSTCTGWIVAAAMALPVFAPQAAAQEFDFVQAIVKPQVNIERARHLRRLIRERGEDLLKRRMGAGATGTVYPLAYGEDGVEAVEAEAAEPKGINLWIDGNGGRLEDSNALRGYDGTQYALSFGGDAQLSERVILGAVGVSQRERYRQFIRAGRLVDAGVRARALCGGVPDRHGGDDRIAVADMDRQPDERARRDGRLRFARLDG